MVIKRWTSKVTKFIFKGGNNMEAIAIRQDVKKAIKKPYNIVNVIKAKNKNIDTFNEMISIGERFKKSLGLSDEDVYNLLKR